MKGEVVICPVCGEENEVYGSGFYGTYECQHCSTDEDQVWFNGWGQSVCSPEEQVQCEDW